MFCPIERCRTHQWPEGLPLWPSNPKEYVLTMHMLPSHFLKSMFCSSRKACSGASTCEIRTLVHKGRAMEADVAVVGQASEMEKATFAAGCFWGPEVCPPLPFLPTLRLPKASTPTQASISALYERLLLFPFGSSNNERMVLEF
jgi:hypothetical protein